MTWIKDLQPSNFISYLDMLCSLCMLAGGKPTRKATEEVEGCFGPDLERYECLLFNTGDLSVVQSYFLPRLLLSFKMFVCFVFAQVVLCWI